MQILSRISLNIVLILAARNGKKKKKESKILLIGLLWILPLTFYSLILHLPVD